MNQEQVAKVLEAVRRKLDPAAQEKARNALAWAYRIGHRDEGNRAERRAFAAEKRGKGLHGWRQRHQRVGQKYPTAQFLPTGEPCTCPREAIALCRCGWPS